MMFNNSCLKKYYLVFIFISFISGKVQSQTSGASDSVIAKITENFAKQLRLYPQEKLYTQIDKSYCVAGENIWFRTYLADASTNIPDSISRYVYAELTYPMDSVISRVKVRPVRGAYHGYISLAEDLAEGEYQLRFYTRLMESLGDNYFFKRSVRIGDPLTALYRTEPEFSYEDGKRIRVKLRITDIKDNTFIKPDKVEIMDDNGNLRLVKVKDDYTIDFSLKAPAKKKVLFVKYDYKGKFHKEYITIPSRPDFEVSFLPEGGYNIAGTVNRIAFKALNSDGLGEDIEGILINEKGDTLNSFRSTHLGMGMLILNSQVDSILYAICRNKKGLEKKYQIPAATDKQVALSISSLSDRFMLSLRIPNEEPLNNSYHVVIQCRGHVLNIFKWNKEKAFATISKTGLPSGVIQILLVDSNMNPVSERLVFNVNKADLTDTEFITNKSNYAGREQVKGSIKLKGFENNGQIAGLSVSVTDDKDVKIDTCVNILSSLLLTSELKGYIESPAYYFSDDVKDKPVYADLLMMTQGWSRYDVGRILKGDLEKPKGYLELGQYLSGTVKGGFFMNKKSEGYPVTLISLRNNIFKDTSTNKEGRFYFQGFEAPDSTTFIVQGLTKKGKDGVDLLIDEEIFPENKFSLPFSSVENRSLFEKYMKKADENFILANGMRMIYLKEVEILGRKKADDNKERSVYSSNMNPRISHEEFEKSNPADIFHILRNFAGVQVSGNNISIRGGKQPLILVDDMQYETDMLSDIPISDIDEVEIIKDGTAAIFGMRGGNGVIMITTKRGEINFKKNDKFNIKSITPLGYQVTKEFYSPQYATKEQRAAADPDLRTTVYWNPDIKTNESGKADINFYTSDASTTYSVVIEGITSGGSLIHSVHKISRKD